MQHQEPNNKGNRELYRAMGLVTTIGIDLAGCTIGGTLLGKWLDSQLGTTPLMILLGLLLGLAAGIYGIIRLLSVFGFGEEPSKKKKE